MDPRNEATATSGRVAGVDEPGIPAEGLQLHLGSGPHAEPGWVNVDKSWTSRISRIRPLVEVLARAGMLSEQQRATRWPREVIRRDLSRPLEWGDASARAIYSSHMVEHFGRSEARRLLEECLRVLAPGGVLRLVLPDVEAGVRRYLNDKAAGNRRAADELVGSLFYGWDAEMPRVRRVAFGLLHRPHQWMYDADSMMELLDDVGFARAQACGYRVGACPDLSTLETRGGALEGDSFYVEAFKPA